VIVAARDRRLEPAVHMRLCELVERCDVRVQPTATEAARVEFVHDLELVALRFESRHDVCHYTTQRDTRHVAGQPIRCVPRSPRR
jgi:hypothetical protein